jgi:hypothetical protein
MRSIFFGFVSVFATTYAFSGENMPSVLTHDNAQPAVVTTAPAAVTTPTVILACENCEPRAATPQLICVNGRCGEQRLYSVQSREEEHSRNRLFGGKVIRRHSRTVVRPVR